MPSLVLPSATLLAGASAIVLRSNPPAQPKLTAKTWVAMPMQMFRADCSVTFNSKTSNPGAGMNASTAPGTKVLKDGFYGVECVDEFMFEHGDKFGDNAAGYEIEQTANVSIVSYSHVVAKEDAESMTPAVCFSFCRTIPDMNFFGIRNGGDCYCTPYYRSIPGDNKVCDVVCEGDGRQVCGSSTKSSMFGMHMCASTGADMSGLEGKMQGVEADLTSVQGEVDSAWGGMQSAAEEYQTMFSSAGDTAATEQMQAAKVHAGKLQQLSVDASKILTGMTNVSADASALGTDFSDASKLSKAEAAMDKMEGLTAEGIASLEEMWEQANTSYPNPAGAEVAEQYYPVMYFVNKDNETHNMSTTCGGTSSHSPIVGNQSACAAACDGSASSNGGSCIGFQYFPKAGNLTADQGLCFLLSKFRTMTYYTECGGAPKNVTDPSEIQCFAKFSKFGGTSLAVDNSGDCKECFQEVTKAERCYAP